MAQGQQMLLLLLPGRVFVSLCASLLSATYAASSCSEITSVLFIQAYTRALSHLFAADSVQVRLLAVCTRL